MTASQDEVVDLMVEGVLGAVRRDVFAMAAAHQRNDKKSEFLAYTRARHLQLYAMQLGALGDGTLARLQPALAMACEAVDAWAELAPKLALAPSEISALITEVAQAPTLCAEIVAVDSVFANFDLNDLPLVALNLRGSDLVGVSAKRANLDRLDAQRATLRRCRFDYARMRHASLREVTMDGVSVECANLEKSDWSGARVTQSSLAGALCGGASLEETRFAQTSLRDVDFSTASEVSTCGATFVRCDLRASNWAGRDLSGVVFRECKLYGIHGDAKLEFAEFEKCDLTPEGNASRMASPKDVRKHWRLDAARVIRQPSQCVGRRV